MKEFLDRIKISPSGCWIFHNKKGEPLIYGGFTPKVRYNTRGYRFSYEYYIGEIPVKKCVCHTCDNPFCVSPFHLFLGTQKENLIDMSAKGRKSKNMNRHENLMAFICGCRCEICLNTYTKLVGPINENPNIRNLK